MTRLNRTPTLAVSALVVAAGTCLAESPDGPATRGEGVAAEPVEISVAAGRETAGKQKLYFRPFCRRSRYVTNRSAPCW
jgi:hypothetical protein